MKNRYIEYLSALKNPFKKLAKIEFLQPDNSVAFSLDNNYHRGYNTLHDSRAFIQSGSLNVNLQNGQRRTATVTLANIDNAYDYSINKIWFGQRIRLSMGLILPDGTDFYLPQGVFYVNAPNNVYSPSERTVTLNLVDKWSYLDGSLFGNLENTYQIPATDGAGTSTNTNIFSAMSSILQLSRIDFSNNAPSELQIDNVAPVFTSYYNGKTYQIDDSGTTAPMTDIPYDITVGSADSGTFADVLLELNTILAGWIGYDQTGTLRVEPSQDDIDDSNRAILWSFDPLEQNLCSISETFKDSEVYNDIIITGESLSDTEIYGRATNFDPKSDTNVNIIGKKTYRENRAEYWNPQQCVDVAAWMLKRKTVLQKSISITSTQMFHLSENNLVTVRRTDKPGNPIERHIIQSFSLPIAETGSMTIECTSVNDIPNFTYESSKTETESTT